MSAVAALNSHEVLDLVSEADDDDQQSNKRLSSLLPPPRSPSHHSMSDSEAVRLNGSPRKRLKLSVSPAASPARSLPSNGDDDDDDAGSVITVSSRDTRGSENDEDDVIDFSDLETDVTSTSVLHTSTPITVTSQPADEQPTSALTAYSGKKRKQAVARYFGSEDLSLKCFNCGAAGHKSEDCPVDKACYICGQSRATHTQKRGCPNEPCWRCGGIGHQKSDCSAARFLPRLCYRCGSTSHDVSRCTTPPSSSFWDLSTIHCYVCGQLGHINCSPPSFSSSPLYCCNCASPYHSHINCRQERMLRDVQVEEYTGGGSAYKRTMECFRCGQIGHSKAECTWSSRTNRRSFGSGGSAIVSRSGGAGGMRLSYSHLGGGGYTTNGRSASEKGNGRSSRSRERDDRHDRHRSSSKSSGSSHRSSSSSSPSWRLDRDRSGNGEQEHYTRRKRKR